MKKTNISRLSRLIILGLLVTLFSACINPFMRFQKPISENQSPKKEKYVQKFTSRKFDLSANTGKLSSQVFEALNKEDFSWLELQAAKARKDKEVLTGGYWKIRTIYTGLSAPVNNTDEEYKKHFERLNRWKEQFPESITPRVAIASSWLTYAGEARGSGYADTVTDDGWKLLNERMRNSEKELLEAKDLPEQCPHWYVEMLETAKVQSWDFDNFDALYQEAIAFEPNYYYFYRQKAMYLLPRWSGEEGQWEDYLEQISQENGVLLYYLTLSFFVLNVGEIQFDRNKFSWERAKQGFDELKQTYGVEKQRLNEFAKFSCLANEFPTANETFNEIGEDWDKEVWRTKATFDDFRLIASKATESNDRKISLR